MEAMSPQRLATARAIASFAPVSTYPPYTDKQQSLTGMLFGFAASENRSTARPLTRSAMSAAGRTRYFRSSSSNISVCAPTSFTQKPQLVSLCVEQSFIF
jgi:hypothetical protein